MRCYVFSSDLSCSETPMQEEAGLIQQRIRDNNESVLDLEERVQEAIYVKWKKKDKNV